MNYVIVGNGVAGISAAEAIRQLDPGGRLTMIAAETFPPYCRPMISLLLEGAVTPEKLPIRPPSFYEQLQIQPILGDSVVSLDVPNRMMHTRQGRTVAFDRLLIATGADPNPIPAMKPGMKNVFFMRTEVQVRQMLDVLPQVRQALVLGGGLVGFKAAYALLHRGLQATMLIRSDYPLAMQVDDQAGKMILKELVGHGLEVKVGVDVTGFDGVEKVTRAHLSDGTDLPCDLVIVSKGVSPALSFVSGDQIKVNQGIVVDEYLATTAAGIFAAGDVAEARDITRGTCRINAIWPEAVDQGRLAGMNMAGRRVAYRGSLGRNVIRIFDLDVMTGGLVHPPAEPAYEVHSALDLRRRTYRKLVFHQDRLVGIIMVNAIDQGGILLSLIRSRMPLAIPREQMLSPAFNYRTLLR
ncbi:MAG: NAD(P)/FAD-dependent oxidoreductase [Deltaproteobacteria bacterium]|nr:NAD(P)/FAD-dependent oxidoreductase [Deltaproteobacteria bacterium]